MVVDADTGAASDVVAEAAVIDTVEKEAVIWGT